MPDKIKRRRSRQIKAGNVKIGGGAPVPIQSMTKTDTQDWQATVKQIKCLQAAGCQIIRSAVKNTDAVKALKKIRAKISIPLVADIHFDYRLALGAIDAGADKIRINPGNMKSEEKVREVVRAARLAKIPIRIGLNSGSVKSSVVSRQSSVKKDKGISGLMIKTALRYIRLFEKEKFYDIIVSLKASDVITTVAAYRRLAKICDYPLHLGITASGTYDEGVVKSSIGIGALLLDGIGDTIRVSLTADPEEEVAAAKRILQSLGLRRFYPEVISCPTCGRCQVDLFKIVNDFEKKITDNRVQRTEKKFTTVAIMGCEVNGPGEAREADIGIAAGKKSGILFKKGKKIKKIAEKDFVEVLIEQLSLRA